MEANDLHSLWQRPFDRPLLPFAGRWQLPGFSEDTQIPAWHFSDRKRHAASCRSESRPCRFRFRFLGTLQWVHRSRHV